MDIPRRERVASYYMITFRFSLAFVCLTVPVIAEETAPAQAEAVKAAVQKLAAAPNYSWRITMSTGGDSRFTPGPLEGRTVKNGCTRWVMTFGEHRIDACVKNGQVAVKTEEGWSKPEDRKPFPSGVAPLPSHKDGEARISIEARKDGESVRRDGHRKGSKSGFLARRLQSMKAPAEMAADLAAKVPSLKVDGDGMAGNLTTEAALELLTFGNHRREGGGGPPQPANPRGSVKFWLKDGFLHKLEIHLAASLSLNGSDVPIDSTTVVEINNVGTTSVDVPAEARKLLDAESPVPAAPAPSPAPAKKPA